jgi:Co/Zn/Cd efflux system component
MKPNEATKHHHWEEEEHHRTFARHICVEMQKRSDCKRSLSLSKKEIKPEKYACHGLTSVALESVES